MLSLNSALRRRFFLHHHQLRLFSSDSSSASTSSSTPSNLSVVINSVFRAESDPNRAVSILFRFPNHLYDRYAGDHALRRLSGASISLTLLDKFLPLAESEKDFAALLLSYGAAQLPSSAIRAFNERICSSLSVSVLSVNALLSALIKSGQQREVHNVFTEITGKHSGIKPDEVSYGLLVQALFKSKKFDLAFEILKEIREEKGIVLGPQIYSLLFTFVYKLNNPYLAERFWNEMIDNGFKPDFDAYRIKVWCHHVRLNAQKVIEVLREMEVNGFKPDVDMYNSLLICYCKNGSVDRAFELYKAMKEENDFSLNFDTFSILMNGLNRAEDFETGIEVFRDSVRIDRIPKFSIVRDFVQLLVKYGKMEEAKEVVIETKKKPRKLNGKMKKIDDMLGQELMVLLFGH
ncbi:hypothetical protein LUZ60_016538 [Juncus effusus]|nr:hypothetical protein LUZ60_016538 [Juncus effusus]